MVAKQRKAVLHHHKKGDWFATNGSPQGGLPERTRGFGGRAPGRNGASAPQTERLATLQARKAGRPERTRGFGGRAPGRNGALAPQTERLATSCKPFCLWCWEESNCRHMDFQSIALPSELQHRIGTAKVRIFFILQKIMLFSQKILRKWRQKWLWRRDMSRCCCLSSLRMR